jgi:hypothetical protein
VHPWSVERTLLTHDSKRGCARLVEGALHHDERCSGSSVRAREPPKNQLSRKLVAGAKEPRLGNGSGAALGAVFVTSWAVRDEQAFFLPRAAGSSVLANRGID